MNIRLGIFVVPDATDHRGTIIRGSWSGDRSVSFVYRLGEETAPALRTMGF